MIFGALPRLAGRLPAPGAALAALGDPDAQGPRSLAWLAWAVILSVALHAAVLSAFSTFPFRFEGQVARFALTARIDAATPVPAATASAPDSRPQGETPPAGSVPGAAASAAASGATLPHRYFSSREVDVPAAVLEQPPLVYPEDPYVWRLSGTVRLRVYIEADGRVDKVEVVAAEPRGHFEAAALAAGRALRYIPARIGDQPVRSQKQIDVVFDPHEHLRHDASRR